MPLFSELAKRHPRKLARLADAMDRIEYAEGDTIIRQDEEVRFNPISIRFNPINSAYL